jgi:hypothetical protein
VVVTIQGMGYLTKTLHIESRYDTVHYIEDVTLINIDQFAGDIIKIEQVCICIVTW